MKTQDANINRLLNIVNAAFNEGYDVKEHLTLEQLAGDAANFLIYDSAARRRQEYVTLENSGGVQVLHWEDGLGYVYHGSGDYPTNDVVEVVVDSKGEVVELIAKP
jgi:hypothetical protein